MEKSSLEPLYDPEAVRPMWEELAQCGVITLRTVSEVDEAVRAFGTTLVVVTRKKAVNVVARRMEKKKPSWNCRAVSV